MVSAQGSPQYGRQDVSPRQVQGLAQVGPKQEGLAWYLALGEEKFSIKVWTSIIQSIKLSTFYSGIMTFLKDSNRLRCKDWYIHTTFSDMVNVFRHWHVQENAQKKCLVFWLSQDYFYKIAGKSSWLHHLINDHVNQSSGGKAFKTKLGALCIKGKLIRKRNEINVVTKSPSLKPSFAGPFQLQ